MIFPKQPMPVFVKRIPNGKLKAKVTYNDNEHGAPMFEGSGYADEDALLTAIRLSMWVPEDRFSEGIELVYVG